MKKGPVNAWRGNPYKRPGSPFWSIVFTDGSGIVRRRSTKTKDLRIARDLLATTLRDIEKLKAGYVDRYAETRTTPIGKLIDAYKQHLEAEDSAPRYVKGTIRMLRDFTKFAKTTTVASIAIADAERFAADVRTRCSAKTRDHYAGALRSFGRWLERTGRWERDPFHGLALHTAHRDKHRVFKRVSFRYEEAERFVEAAWARYEAERALGGTPMQGDYCDDVKDRQVLYWFTLTTAFRANECASVRWEDLTLDGPKLAVRLSGQFTKNGDDANVPLQGFVAQALKEVRARRSKTRVRRGAGPVQETEHVFHLPSKIAEIVRKDAAYAGLIPQRGATSKRVDFHCLR